MARVLIADDSLIMRRNLKSILEQAGHVVVGEAMDGAQAFIEYEKNKPELVTMDITMPRMNGIEAIQKIIEYDSAAKIVVISALAERDMVFEALECGARNYIIKPIVYEKVCLVLDEVLASDNKPIALGIKKERPRNFSGAGRFTILNDQGTFVVNVTSGGCFGGVESPIYTAVQGLLYVSPLTMVFDFGKTEIGEIEFNNLLEIMESIKKGGGKVQCKSVPLSYEKSLHRAGYL